MYSCVNTHMHHNTYVGKRTTNGSLFSPFHYMGPGIKVMSSCWVTHAFTEAVSLALCIYFEWNVRLQVGEHTTEA